MLRVKDQMSPVPHRCGDTVLTQYYPCTQLHSHSPLQYTSDIILN
jgi:hypothetical protein